MECLPTPHNQNEWNIFLNAEAIPFNPKSGTTPPLSGSKYYEDQQYSSKAIYNKS